ncbi:alpha-L-fucosidase [Actinorhabdospora filicis]|uniref:alpha-L-fucosidase n=1 Tax=Actinorhabdospora filicis TaxID=1785913 RepID=A0A9W6SSV4_9ACTN|nr:alpha-L-fucosidase [Actinorhabdospora filicis]GLZ81702.1 alpha-L-fucosidase [Actinorhabdospora filicis]
MTDIAPLAERAAWFTHDRFGLFVHWGVYAAAARHEWVMARERLTDGQYAKYAEHFDPDLYDPVQWAEDAWQAGMRYFVITTKHHDGFCLFDSELTDYSAPHTPAGRDLLRPMVEAFRARGFKVGFYYSLLDWHHPEFPVDLYHPRRDDGEYIAATAGRDVDKYADYLHGQVRELLTNYGRIDLMWFDFSYSGRGLNAKGAPEWRSAELLALVRELQPHILVNNRLELGVGPGPETGDFTTPEQVQPPGHENEQTSAAVPWEACQTLNGSWGYDRDNLDWKPPSLLVRMLVDTVSKGGNMLLNVGPTGRGRFDPRARETLAAIGAWTALHEPAIRGAGPSAFVPPPDCRYTQRGDRLYLHVLSWPMKHLHLPGLAGKVAYARFLHDHSEVALVEPDGDDPFLNHLRGLPEGTLTVAVPSSAPEVEVPVIELILRA